MVNYTLKKLLKENRVCEEQDPFVGYISQTYGVSKQHVLDVLRNSSKDDFHKRQKLAELAGILKTRYSMDNYIKNAELIKKYGRKNIETIAKAAKDRNESTYNVTNSAEMLGLTDVADVLQIIPYCEETRDLLTPIKDDIVKLKTYDSEGNMHIYIIDKSDAELSAMLRKVESRSGADQILEKEGIGQKIYYKIFHVLKGNLTPRSGAEQELPTDIFNTTIDNIVNAAYRDDPMEKVIGVPVKDLKPEMELDFREI